MRLLCFFGIHKWFADDSTQISYYVPGVDHAIVRCQRCYKIRWAIGD